MKPVSICLSVLLTISASWTVTYWPGASAPQVALEKEREAVRRAVLDYVEGVYKVKPEWIERSVHPDLKKFGYWRPDEQADFKDGQPMTFEQLRKLAGVYNQDGRISDDAPKDVKVFEVMSRIASAKVDAAWGTDYFQLVKEDGKWKILQVVWQSPDKRDE